MPDWGRIEPDLRARRPGKYRNRPALYNGIEFDSELERNRYIVLSEAEKRGEISELRRQVWFEVVPKQYDKVTRRRNGKEVERFGLVESGVHYVADFVYMKGETMVVEDTKGMKTPAYVIKRKLMRLQGHPIREVKRATESV